MSVEQGGSGGCAHRRRNMRQARAEVIRPAAWFPCARAAPSATLVLCNLAREACSVYAPGSRRYQVENCRAGGWPPATGHAVDPILSAAAAGLICCRKTLLKPNRRASSAQPVTSFCLDLSRPRKQGANGSQTRGPGCVDLRSARRGVPTLSIPVNQTGRAWAWSMSQGIVRGLLVVGLASLVADSGAG